MRAGLRGGWALLLLGLSVTACGGERALPAVCSRGPDAVRVALRSAPGTVRIEGTRLSTCVARASDPGELEAVGGSLVGAAAELARSARRTPGGTAELQLGYLVGAARRGAGRERGERSELLRRLEQEGAGLAGDRGAYRRGLRAGERSG
jgi:hypothetical protein